jgi:hypothetical protein
VPEVFLNAESRTGREPGTDYVLAAMLQRGSGRAALVVLIGVVGAEAACTLVLDTDGISDRPFETTMFPDEEDGATGAEDASVDSRQPARPDAAPDVVVRPDASDASTVDALAPGIRCDNLQCNTTQTCCILDSAECNARVYGCASGVLAIRCDEPSDCPGLGQVCCGTYLGSGRFGGSACTAPSNCTPPDQYFLCDPSRASDCPAGKKCRQLQGAYGLFGCR